MENKEKNPKVVVIDRREDNGVLLTRRIAERYGTEKYLSLPGTYRKIGEEAFKGNGKIERLGLPDWISPIRAKWCSRRDILWDIWLRNRTSTPPRP